MDDIGLYKFVDTSTTEQHSNSSGEQIIRFLKTVILNSTENALKHFQQSLNITHQVLTLTVRANHRNTDSDVCGQFIQSKPVWYEKFLNTWKCIMF
jgi:hypothetical protein